jgi:hypothetical protein
MVQFLFTGLAKLRRPWAFASVNPRESMVVYQLGKYHWVINGGGSGGVELGRFAPNCLCGGTARNQAAPN